MKVYIAADPDTRIAPGSGVVGTPIANDPATVCVDYEGNLYGAENIVTFADRVMVAAQRHADRAPTRARAYLPASALTEVGEWDGRTVTVYFDAMGSLAGWLGATHLVGSELYPTGAYVEAEERLLNGNR